MKILASDGSNPWNVVQINTNYTYKADKDSKDIEWKFQGKVLPKGSTATINVATVSKAANDMVLEAKLGADTTNIKVTAVDFRSLSTEFNPTPSLRANSWEMLKYLKVEQYSNRKIPAYESTLPCYEISAIDFNDGRNVPSSGFDDEYEPPKDILFLIRGYFQQTLNANVIAPPNVVLRWEVLRNPRDNAALSTTYGKEKPSLTNTATGGKSCALSQDATGSFVINSWIMCASGKKHCGRSIKLILLDVSLKKDNTTIDPRYYRDIPALQPEDKGIILGGWSGGSDALLDQDQRPKNKESEDGGKWGLGYMSAITLSSSIQILSGGAEADLFLHRMDYIMDINWFNNTGLHTTPNEEDYIATYKSSTGTRRVTSFYKLAPTEAHKVAYYTQVSAKDTKESKDPKDFQSNITLQGPVFDGNDNDGFTRPNYIRLAAPESSVPEKAALGYTMNVGNSDSTNQAMPLYYPVPAKAIDKNSKNVYVPEIKLDLTSPIESMSVNELHMSALGIQTVSAPWIVSILCKQPWGLKGQWNFTKLTTTPPKELNLKDFKVEKIKKEFTKGAVEVIYPPKPANMVNMEVWPPVTMSGLALKIEEVPKK